MPKNAFFLQLSKLESLIDEVGSKRDKGLALFKSSARTVLFNLEALCRLYRNGNEKKFFDRWYKEFKALEDTLGAMDFHEACFTEFDKYKEFKSVSQKIFHTRFDQESGFLSDVLRSNGWLDGSLTTQFKTGLEALSWPDAKAERDLVIESICSELSKLKTKYEDGELNPSSLEKGLHEFRRRLRWTSIYAGTLNGMIQLQPVKLVPERMRKYQTKEILQLPFNALPKPLKDFEVITIQSYNFYALSWMIQQLGVWKDVGLRNGAFLELQKESGKTLPELRKKFLSTCSVSPDSIDSLAEEAIDEFVFHDRILDGIVRDLKRNLHRVTE